MHQVSHSRHPLKIAHRGVQSEGYENSLAAFRAAVDNLALGIDAVELDIHSTADGEIVVHHDPVTASGLRIASASSHDLAADRLPDGSNIPTLAQALDILGMLQVFVEAKGLAAEADATLLRVLLEGPNPAGYQLHAFDHRIIARLGDRSRDFGLGVLSCSYPIEPERQVLAAGATTLWQEWHLIDRELVERCASQGIAVIGWTVPAAESGRLAALGVAGICANL